MHTYLRAARLAILALGWLSIPAFGNDGGIFGFSGNPATSGGASCNSCHSGGVAPVVSVSGPTVVGGDETNTYTLTISGGQAVACGMDVSADFGELFATEVGTRLFASEVTHAGPRAVDGSGTCTYQFDWTSPVAAGTSTLYVAGNSVNLSQTTAGDRSAKDTLTITVNGALPGMLPPVADANGPHGVVLGGAITFDGSGSFDPDGSVVQWDWDFGDGNIASGVGPQHTFATSGAFSVTLTVTDDQGRTDTDTTLATVVDQPGTLQAIRLIADARLQRATWVTAPQGDPRLFIVTQGDVGDAFGRIWILEGGALLPTPFLELPVAVQGDQGGDFGLRGLAFAPDYSTSGLFYVIYSRIGGLPTAISRMRVSPTNPDLADLASLEDLITVFPPNVGGFHLGSHLEFGPDGLLYASLGDAGIIPQLAQDDDTLWGKVLRIDVSGGLGSGYQIPTDNPFVGPGPPLDEIWAKGFRNPYRFSIDPWTGDLYIADVGQANEEEIDVESGSSFGGRNYGWPLMEGTICTGGSPACTDGSLTSPVHTYTHQAGRCAVIGAALYRGVIPAIGGRFFFADFCTTQVWSFIWDGAASIVDLRDHSADLIPNAGSLGTPSAIGRDGYGELVMTDFVDGEVFRIRSTLPDGDGDGVPDSVDNCVATANPGQADADLDGVGDACDDACSNGLDDDGDGRTDFPADPGCQDPDDVSERDPGLLCDDGIDNDLDGGVDFDPTGASGDIGCRDPAWSTENPECSDGINNDPASDLLIDFDGGASAGLPAGQQTAPDPACKGNPWTLREVSVAPTCGLGPELIPALCVLLGVRRKRSRAAKRN